MIVSLYLTKVLKPYKLKEELSDPHIYERKAKGTH